MAETGAMTNADVAFFTECDILRSWELYRLRRRYMLTSDGGIPIGQRLERMLWRAWKR